MRVFPLLTLLLALALPAGAQERVVVGVSEDRVSINANFDGSEILVFGAVRRDVPPPAEPQLDVIVTVEGPRTEVEVRKKTRQAGIWINTESATVEVAPSFYAVASTRALPLVLSVEDDINFQISPPRRLGGVVAPAGTEDPKRFAEALVRLREASGAYIEDADSVDLAEQTLFSTKFALPSNLVEGDYRVRIFLVRGGQVIDRYFTEIGVRKVGLERALYSLAHLYPVLYGLLALAIAAVAGWSASVFFRLLNR